jgi:transposase
MLRPSNDLLEVYLCVEPIDFRKRISGLSVWIESELGRNPFSEHLYVFCNRRRDKVKLLYWERNGFCLWEKHLEKDRFSWPKEDGEGVLTVTGQQLNWLLDGIDISRVKRHETLCFSSVL